ncbi:T9SS type A sorting domain-containing protein [Ferruginibacter albus]|uniref:T9SS type A sorting domain-containing protein n=1 Tax=Ferruginibacter albus TaxID=2875540 RepID=UPI001CC7AC42|nr:T9SS type A sorting domain-containing protein [Ferruginibacter albus]UAY53443.1 T9SS type A sorting domain-containing protein [Ferruginibacter albus]
MKTNSTFVSKAILAFSIFTFLFVNANAQCSAPSLKFKNPVLKSGTAGSVNAIYKFSNVTTGIDAYVKIVDIVGGATLSNIDNTSVGYGDAWQPEVNGPSTNGNTSYIKWTISFIKANDSSAYSFSCFTLSAIDIDGDGKSIKEFVKGYGTTNYSLHIPSNLTATNEGDGVKALGSVDNQADIDTSAWITNVNFNYNNVNTVTVATGATVVGKSPSTDRYACIFFQKIGNDQEMTNVVNVVLPVNYVSFTGVKTNNGVVLDWSTDKEINNSHFEVEQSLDNNNFKSVGLVLDGMSESNGRKSYEFTDNSAANADVVYYRIKQVDVDGKIAYSKVIAIRSNSSSNIVMQVSPNPFAEQLKVQFSAEEKGTATIRLISMSGSTVAFKQSIISKGFNNVQVLSLGGLPKGIYAAQLMVNGVVVSTQKVVKN